MSSSRHHPVMMSCHDDMMTRCRRYSFGSPSFFWGTVILLGAPDESRLFWALPERVYRTSVVIPRIGWQKSAREDAVDGAALHSEQRLEKKEGLFEKEGKVFFETAYNAQKNAHGTTCTMPLDRLGHNSSIEAINEVQTT